MTSASRAPPMLFPVALQSSYQSRIRRRGKVATYALPHGSSESHRILLGADTGPPSEDVFMVRKGPIKAMLESVAAEERRYS